MECISPTLAAPRFQSVRVRWWSKRGATVEGSTAVNQAKLVCIPRSSALRCLTEEVRVVSTSLIAGSALAAHVS